MVISLFGVEIKHCRETSSLCT